MIQLIFNVFPLSINKLYVNIPGQKRRFISTDGKKFKKLIEDEVKVLIKDPKLLKYISSLEGKRLTVYIKVTSTSWLLKDGKSIARKDISSCEKALVDSIFTALNDMGFTLDDKQIFDLRLVKDIGETDITLVQISEYMS